MLFNCTTLNPRATLGFAENDDKHCTILNRLIDFTVRESGPLILYEPGPRHVELLLEHLGLDGTKIKGVSTPGEKRGTYHDETELEKSKVTLYRSCVMSFVFFECRSSARAVSCESIGTWHVQAHDRTLEPIESCAVFEDGRTMDSRIPSSGTNEFDRHLHRFGLGK